VGNAGTLGLLKRWFFTGPNVAGSPYLFGSTGPTPPQCHYLPSGPLIGIRSYLDPNKYFCGVDLAYNKCSCTSAKFLLTDYSLKTIIWQVSNPPANQAWIISNSISSAMSNYTVKTCGNFLLSPVTTSVNSYTPVSIVTAGFITSTVGNTSSITVASTDHTINGTFKVLL
jgi:hypothetical protein